MMKGLHKTFGFLIGVLFVTGMSTGVMSQTFEGIPEAPAKSEAAMMGVESITIYRYRYRAGKMDATGAVLSYSQFNLLGSLREQVTYMPDGGILQKTTYRYEDGKVYDTSTYQPENVGTVVNTYEHDENDNVTRSVSRRPDGSLVSTMEFDYDTDGTISRAVSYDPQGGVYLRINYEYDSGGKLTRTITYSAVAGGSKTETVYGYDPAGRRSEVQRYDKAGNIQARSTFSYDSEGNLQRMVSYRPDGAILSETSTAYDEDGRALETTVKLPASGVTTRTVVKYDDRGNRLELMTYNKLDEPVNLISYVYEYFDR